MVGGFNHNFNYKGRTYHVQTEDSGIQRAQITTLLYRAGSIIARESSNYTDISSAPDLEQQVEERMKDQHRAMLKKLKNGEFDAKILQLDQPVLASTVVKREEEVVLETLPETRVATVPELVNTRTGTDESATHAQPDSGRNTAGEADLGAVLRDYLNAGRI